VEKDLQGQARRHRIRGVPSESSKSSRNTVADQLALWTRLVKARIKPE